MAVMFFGVSSVYADDNRAVFIETDSCGIATGPFSGVITTDVKLLRTNSANGVSKLTCSTTTDAPEDGKAHQLNADDFDPVRLCYADGRTTDTWHSNMSAKGNLKLTCHFKND